MLAVIRKVGVVAPSVERSCRVLVVDDDRDNADSASVMLAQAGYACRTAYDIRAAVVVAAEFRPQVVLLDIGMPGNGLSIVPALRRLGQVHVVVVSGWADGFHVRQADAAGVDGYLLKPVPPDELFGILADICAEVG